tara:strand:- start:125 stop:706 length:582 start_codon:yes stop_codon:yes gene_type:complete
MSNTNQNNIGKLTYLKLNKMKKPLKELLARIEVKSVKFHRGHDGMQGLNCKLYVDGKFVADVYDDARGGCFDYNQYVRGKFHKFDWMGTLEAYDLRYTIDIGDEWDSKHNWDSIVDIKVNEAQRLKDAKKGVMVQGVGSTYSIVGFNYTIPNCIKKWGKDVIVKELQGIVDKKVSEGKEILNTKYLSEIGVKV